MTPETLLALLEEVEREDPVDFTGLPFNPHDLRALACLNVIEVIESLAQDSTQEDQYLVLAATVARLVLENMVLQARIAILTQE